MSETLWLKWVRQGGSSHGGSALFNVSFKTCRNCGKVKIASSPCSFDHLAAILEFNAFCEGAGVAR